MPPERDLHRTSLATERWVLDLLGPSVGQPVILIDYFDLWQLAQNGEMTPGQVYQIQDYYTYWMDDNNTIRRGELEKLTVKAASESGIHSLAISDRWPEDVIHYEFENNLLQTIDKNIPAVGAAAPPAGEYAWTWTISGGNTGVRMPNMSGHLGNHLNERIEIRWFTPASGSNQIRYFVSNQSNQLVDSGVSHLNMTDPFHPALGAAIAPHPSRLRPGFISRRALPKQNIDIAWDWRNLLWRLQVPGSATAANPSGAHVLRHTLSAVSAGNEVIWTGGPVAKNTAFLRDIILSNMPGTVLHFHNNADHSHSHSIEIANWAFRNRIELSNIIKIAAQSCDNVIIRSFDITIGAEAFNNIITEACRAKIRGGSSHNHIYKATGVSINMQAMENEILQSEAAFIGTYAGLNIIVNSPQATLGERAYENHLIGATNARVDAEACLNCVTNSENVILGVRANNNNVFNSPGAIIQKDCKLNDIGETVDVELTSRCINNRIYMGERINLGSSCDNNWIHLCKDIHLAGKDHFMRMIASSHIIIEPDCANLDFVCVDGVNIRSHTYGAIIAHSTDINIGCKTHGLSRFGNMMHGQANQRLTRTRTEFEGIPSEPFELSRAQNLFYDDIVATGDLCISGSESVTVGDKVRLAQVYGATFGTIAANVAGLILSGVAEFSVASHTSNANLGDSEFVILRGGNDGVTVSGSSGIIIDAKTHLSSIIRCNDIHIGYSNSLWTITECTNLKTGKNSGNADFYRVNDVTIGENCYENSLRDGTTINIGSTSSRNIVASAGKIDIGNHCDDNRTLRCNSVSIDDYSARNRITDAGQVIIGKHCHNNRITHCHNVSFGNNCNDITLPRQSISPSPLNNITEVNIDDFTMGDNSRMVVVKLKNLHGGAPDGTTVEFEGTSLIPIDLNEGAPWTPDSMWYLDTSGGLGNGIGQLEVNVPEWFALTPITSLTDDHYGARNVAVIEIELFYVNDHIYGEVLDSDGNPVEHARIDAIRTTTGVRHGTYTNEQGRYAQWVPLGTHRVFITHPEFNARVSDIIHIDGNGYNLNIVDFTRGHEARVLTAQLNNMENQGEARVTLSGMVRTWLQPGDEGYDENVDENYIDEHIEKVFENPGSGSSPGDPEFNHFHWLISTNIDDTVLGGVGDLFVTAPGFTGGSAGASTPASFWENIFQINRNMTRTAGHIMLNRTSLPFLRRGNWQQPAAQTLQIRNVALSNNVNVRGTLSAGYSIILPGATTPTTGSFDWVTITAGQTRPFVVSIASTHAESGVLTLETNTGQSFNIPLEFELEDVPPPLPDPSLIQIMVTTMSDDAVTNPGITTRLVNLETGVVIGSIGGGASNAGRTLMSIFPAVIGEKYVLISSAREHNAQVYEFVAERDSSLGDTSPMFINTILELGINSRIITVFVPNSYFEVYSPENLTIRLGAERFFTPLSDESENRLWILSSPAVLGVPGGVGLVTLETDNLEPEHLRISRGDVRMSLITSRTIAAPAVIPTTGIIRGVVLDDVGNPVAQTYVTLIGTDSNSTVLTNLLGEYRFNTIPNGKYVLVFGRHNHNIQRTDMVFLNNFGNVWFGGFRNVHFGSEIVDMVYTEEENDFMNVPNKIWENSELRKDIYLDHNGHVCCKYVHDGGLVTVILR